jgi:hypothetical protein
MVKDPRLTSDQVVLRALRELCRGAGERPDRAKPTDSDVEPMELPSSVRTLRPQPER